MPRRQRGTVGFRDGSWFIYYRTATGKQVYKRGFRTEAKAIESLNEILSQIYRGEYAEPKDITFVEFAEDYVKNRLSIRGSTSASYASLVRRHLIPYFGKMRLQNIRLDVIQSFVRNFEEELSVKTLHNVVTLLKVMLASAKGSSAIKQGYIRHDPTQGLELPPLETRTIIPPTQEMVWKLINVASFSGHNANVMVHLGAFTGLRRGEMLALGFNDIDWGNREILVNKALTRFSAKDGAHVWQWKIGSTKTKRSVRRIALFEDVITSLVGLRQSTHESDGLLFPDKNGRPMDPDYFDSLFAQIKQNAGFPEMRFHDLRHFFASLLISQGLSPKYVCDQLGHSSIQVTFDTYGHLFPKAKQEAARRLQKSMFAGRQEEPTGSAIGSKTQQNAEQSQPERRLN